MSLQLWLNVPVRHLIILLKDKELKSAKKKRLNENDEEILHIIKPGYIIWKIIWKILRDLTSLKHIKLLEHQNHLITLNLDLFEHDAPIGIEKNKSVCQIRRKKEIYRLHVEIRRIWHFSKTTSNIEILENKYVCMWAKLIIESNKTNLNSGLFRILMIAMIFLYGLRVIEIIVHHCEAAAREICYGSNTRPPAISENFLFWKYIEFWV